jgi:uncharacterized integral membrane protein
MTNLQPGGVDPSRTPGPTQWQKPGGPDPHLAPGPMGAPPAAGYPAPGGAPPPGYPQAAQAPVGPPPAGTQQPVTPAATSQTPGVDRRGRVRRSRASYLWVGMIIAALVLILLLIFIAQNSQTVSIHFLGFNGHLSFAVAVLIAAVCGLLLVAIPGTIRILELRKSLKRAAATVGKPGDQPVDDRNRGRTSSR